MYINHKNKFIFIHVPRTGGKSFRSLWPTQHKSFHLHATFTEALQKVSNIDDYFSFGFIRNPWERMFSLYKLQVKKHNPLTQHGFKYWLINNWPPKIIPHTRRSAMSMLKGVKYIAKYENFENEWDYIFNTIDISRISIPHINTTTKNESYYSYYDDECQEFMLKYHSDDINFGGYTLE